MSKDKLTKLTLKDLMAKKEQVLNGKKKTRDLYIKSLDSVITIEKPSIDLIIDAQKIEEDSGSDKYLVYNCIVEPNLRDRELLKAYDCVEPIEILKIFEDGEISSIAKELMRFAGYNGNVSVVDEIKN